MEEAGVNGVNLLDLSDDVLLYILRHCTPRDLKALGFSCARLGRLVRERSLWRRVDARSERCGVARLGWYVTHALHADTRELRVRGYAGESSGCLGILNCSRQEAEEEQKTHKKEDHQDNGAVGPRPANIERHHACLYISSHSAPGLPRFRGMPLWADAEGTCRRAPGECRGPRFTVSAPLLRGLRARCARLATLALEHCNVDCNTVNLSHMPPTLTTLSLRGTKCYNLPMDKSFLFKIQDHLPLLETLDVSECEWLEPASLLPLSKHTRLRELLMRDCHKLAEFVAYASLSSRYGFRSLQVLDLRGSPVGDSEVAPLAWLPRLQELRLAAGTRAPPAPHGHYVDDALAPRHDLEPWEMQEPEYFKQSRESQDGEFDGDEDVGGRMDVDGADDGDDDDDDDMSGGGSGAIRKPDPREHGECSKSKRDGATTKRKAENGSRDAAVNGDRSRSKRKKNDKKDSSSSDDDSSKDSEDDGYEKRRCQTIVIVDRRYIGDNEDASFVRVARRYLGEEYDGRNEGRSENERDDRPAAGNRNGDANGEEKAPGGKSENDKIQDATTDDKSKVDEPENEKDVSKFANSKDKSQIDDCNKARGADDKTEADKDKENSPNGTENVKQNGEPSGSNVRANLHNGDASEVNRGASTSKDHPVNESGNVDEPNKADDDAHDERLRNGNENYERFIRFRQGKKPIIVNIGAQPEGGQEGSQQERVVRFNSYNIRHEVIDNQQIFNVEIERCSMHGPRAQDQNERDAPVDRPQEHRQPQEPQARPVGDVQPSDRQARYAAIQRALEAMQRETMERARLRDQNPNIINLIRGGEPVDLPPPLAAFRVPPRHLDEHREPRHRVLYVNVGQPANALGPLPNVIQGLVAERDNRILNLSRSHVNPSSLVTDAAVRRFGRAAGNDIRFVLVGIPQPVLGPNDGSGRPERSNLRVLVMNGYRNITDRSLIHLATAAPHLRLLDFRETNVTAQGVENFRSLRPDCEVLFSPYVEREAEWPDEDD